MTSPDPREKESEQYIEQGKDNVLLNIDPTSPPPMKTLVYSPEIKILIARGNKQYDVSADVVAWSLRRPENSIASLVFRLSNKPASNTDLKKLRYNQLFERMDRVTVFLKRIEWVQVFSGYLDSVPHVQIYPGTVNFRASCTLKRLLHTWWDPGLPESQRIFDQSGRALAELENGEMQTDMGLGSLLRRLLVLVGGWNPQNIHIQRFPSGFYDYMEEQIRRLTPGAEKDVRSFKELLLGEGDISMGPGRAAGRQQGITMGGYMVSQPERMLEVIRAVDEMGMGPDNMDLAASQGLGTVAEGVKDYQDQEFSKGQTEVGKNWYDAALKSDAAIHCFMTIAAESNWIMYANRAAPESLGYPYDPGAISTDGSSVGLYQQQNNGAWGSTAQRMNVKASTQMFLEQLNRYEWRNMDRAAACQAVQRSAFADGSNYKKWEQAAIEQVRAIRSGTGTATGAAGAASGNPIPGTNLGGTPVGTNIAPALPGTSNASGVPGTPTVNGMPGPTAAASVVGKPLYDSGGALSCALAQVGKPYVLGANGPDAFDCIAEGTLVATDRGEVPIEEVTTDDRVMTRKGFRRVLRAWKVRDDAEVVNARINGRVLTGTPDHRVWTNNRGWVALAELERFDTVILCRTEKSKKYALSADSMDRSITTMLVRQRKSVYDLTVEGEHEFFANGVLVHNCGSLMQFSYRSIGLEISRTTYTQASQLERIPASNLRPGDMIQPDEGHVVMYVGPRRVVHAPQPGDVVQVAPMWFDPNTAVCLRAPGAEFGGTVPTAFDITKAMSATNAVVGTVTTGLNGSTGTGQTEQVARNLFAYQFAGGQFASAISIMFGGEVGTQEKAFINDEPLIQTVVSFAQAGLRNFQSAPNGDFIAYYPDYFGLDGKDAVFALEDIEMKNVQIDLNDDAMATHVYISGSMQMNGSGGGGVMGWLNSKGVATVENQWLFARMAAAAPHVPGEFIPNGKDVMRKFGARPLQKSMSSVQSGPMEFLLAVQTFMTKWAEQYATTIETTFLPEVFPGMRLHLVDHGLQVYVAEVTHSGDYESGFTTSMVITAPSNPALRNMATNIFNSTAKDIAERQDLMSNKSEVAN